MNGLRSNRKWLIRDGISYIAGIPLRDYTVIKTGENAMGPIAQELQELYPELVRDGDDGYLQVSALSSWQMVKAIQELNMKIEDLEQNLAQTSDSFGFSLSSLVDMLKQVGAYIEQGIVSANEFVANRVRTKELEVEKSIKFGTPENPQGITIYDRSGKPACIRVEDAESGAVKATSGECTD